MGNTFRVTAASWRSHGHGVSSLHERGISLLHLSLILCGWAIAVAASTQTLHAQEGKPAVVHDGDAIVTGFSGVSAPARDLPPGVNPSDETFIDTGAASLKVFDVAKPGQAPDGQLFAAPVRFQAKAGDIGQVFGVALDDAPTPNIYTTATSAFGLQIVAPDSDGDGRPERLEFGTANARWMKGQFGTKKGGGPGSVWKIDGATGEITLFATIETDGRANSGPALGNITFDSDHQQFYVSDLDSGMLHRLDLAGKDLGHFDHGIQGRPAQDLAPVAFDPEKKFEITSKDASTTDPATWGFADDRRQVWGVTYSDGRVYYAVADGPQIWSVGIADDGGFSDDVRWELDPAVNPKGGPISDIAFTSSGDMTLAQRGVRAADYDYSAFQEPGNNRVLRYSLETPDEPRTKSRWKTEPHDYAIGFSASHENGAGGIAIGYGYAQGSDGALDFDVCEGTLWSTGDLLRKRTDLRRELAKGGQLAVNGLQGNALSLVRPDNVPPWKSLFIDFDGGFSGPDAFGHVGDVAILRRCPAERVETPPVGAPPVGVPLEDAPPLVVIPLEDVPLVVVPFVDLKLEKRAFAPRCFKGGKCGFTLSAVNVGEGFFVGNINVRDPDPVAGLGSNTSGWACEWGGGATHCQTAAALAPGERRSFDIVFDIPIDFAEETLNNCASIFWDGRPGDANPGNDDACADVEIGEPDGAPAADGPDLSVTKTASGKCTVGQECDAFAVHVENPGAGDFMGPITVIDTFPRLISFSGVAPNSPWSCVARGNGAVECAHAGPLAAGASLPDLKLLFDIPSTFKAGRFGNNVQLIGQGMRQDVNGGNDSASASVELEPGAGAPGGGVGIPGEPEARLLVTKTVRGSLSRGLSEEWVFDIEVKNISGVIFDRDVWVQDILWDWNAGAAPGDQQMSFATVVNTTQPLCKAAPSTPGRRLIQCDSHLELAPGESLKFQVTLNLKNDPRIKMGDRLRNVFRVLDSVDGAEYRAQAAIKVDAADEPAAAEPDLEVKKTADAEFCEIGETCIFHAAITNLSTLPFDETVTFYDSLFRSNRDHALLQSTLETTDQTFCQTVSRFYLINCVFNLKLAAGETKNYRVTIRVPDDGSLRQGDVLSNALKIASPNYAWDFANGRTSVESSATVIIGGWPEVELDERIGEIDPPARPERKEVPEPAKTPPASERAPTRPGSATDDTDGGPISGDRDCPAGSSYDPDLKRCRINELPPVTCRAGKVVNETCVCGAGHTRRQVSPRNFRCDRNRPTITCTGGRVKKNTCLCPSNTQRQKINATTFRCETPPDRATDDPSGGNISRPTITCTGGTVNRQDNVCICPADTEKVKRNNASWYCKPKAKTCSGGRIYDNYLKQCTCPSSKPSWNTKTQQCEKKAAVITTPPCQSGLYWNGKRKRCECSDVKRRRSDGRCCPSGTEARLNRCVKVSGGQTIAPGAKTPVTIRCDRGTVRKGKCICPKGYTRKTLKKSVYECNKPAAQSNPAGTQTRPSLTTPKQTTPPKQTAPSKQVKPPKQTKQPQRIVPSTPPAGLQCKGGKIKGNLCWCGFGKFPKKISNNVYRCQ
jgi:hypothetical protein